MGIPANADADTIDNKLATFWMANGSNHNPGTAYNGFSTGHILTGDNSLEKPYARIYPRLTTKSNTYTVHVRVQSIQKVPGSVEPADIVDEEKDRVTGEFRGSFVVERYLDPNTDTFDETSTDPLGPYKFRVVSSKQFAQ
jgi:hypothetical protein